MTDDQPRIEYADWVRSDALQQVLPQLLKLRTDPPLRGADDVFVQSVVTQRQLLLTFYQAVLHAMAGYQTLWARDMRRVRQSDTHNPYYLWFGGGKQ